MRLLFADATSPATVEQLESRGHEVVVRPELTAADLPGEISGYDVLVVRSTKVGADVLGAADRLALVVRAGAGTNTIDCDAAAAKGVFVANVPGRNSIAVAELTLGLLLAIDRRIADNVADLRAGRWDKKAYSAANGLYGSTLAIIGAGDIGLAVAERAAAFGITVQVVAKDDREPATQAQLDAVGVVFYDSLEKLVSSSDAVTLHVPSHPETRGMVDAEFLSWMRPGAILINTSRGDVVDQELCWRRSTRRGCGSVSMCMTTSRPPARRRGRHRWPSIRTWWAPITSGPPPNRRNVPSPTASSRSSMPSPRVRPPTVSTSLRAGWAPRP